MTVKSKPDGYQNVTPYIVVEGAAKLIDFLKTVFGAEEHSRLDGPNGTVGHAEVRIGDSMIMLADAGPQSTVATAMLHIYVDDADATYQKALDAGATRKQELKDEFYGDRIGAVRDGFGNEFWIATHVEDVSPEETGRRAQELAGATE